MSTQCGFCMASLGEVPPGVAVRCAACGNMTITPALPPTAMHPIVAAPHAPLPAPMPFSRVDGVKPAASPPPAVVMPSRAGGVDELVGGGITILGIGVVKFLVLTMLGLFFTCATGMFLSLFH